MTSDSAFKTRVDLLVSGDGGLNVILWHMLGNIEKYQGNLGG